MCPSRSVLSLACSPLHACAAGIPVSSRCSKSSLCLPPMCCAECGVCPRLCGPAITSLLLLASTGSGRPPSLGLASPLSSQQGRQIEISRSVTVGAEQEGGGCEILHKEYLVSLKLGGEPQENTKDFHLHSIHYLT